MLPILTSENSGPIGLYLDENPSFLSEPGYEYFKEASKPIVRLQIYQGEQIQVELYSMQLAGKDRIRFSGILHPGMLISHFGKSCFIRLSPTHKHLFHDRACNSAMNTPDAFTIEFPAGGVHLISFIRYSEAFGLSLDLLQPRKEREMPRFLNQRSVIMNKEGIKLLSDLPFNLHSQDSTGFSWEEFVRTYFIWYKDQIRSGSFQPLHFGLEEANQLYEQKDRVIQQADKNLSFHQLLHVAGIHNIYLFRKRLKQLTGLNIREFITEARLTKAASLLGNREFSIKQVSAMTGFVNVSYFTRVFTRYFNETPGRFQHHF